MDDINPVIVPELRLIFQGRYRDPTIAYADDLTNTIIDLIGGEPWVMVDDDWSRVMSPEKLTITDDQGFMYQGLRRYRFAGPFVASTSLPTHDGFRTQKGVGE